LLASINSFSLSQQLAFNQEVSLMEFYAESPFVAKLIGYCKEPLCLIMKYYFLGSLYIWVGENDFKMLNHVRLMLTVCSDIAMGVSLLHNRQIAHCDLKPQNILVDNGKDRIHFVLTDFGISKILTEEYLASEAFQIKNLRGLTISYAAPDSLLRCKQKINGSYIEEKAGDVYSFGGLIFFLLMGHHPWATSSTYQKRSEISGSIGNLNTSQKGSASLNALNASQKELSSTGNLLSSQKLFDTKAASTNTSFKPASTNTSLKQ
jgi:serine/threonine protein kinase